MLESSNRFPVQERADEAALGSMLEALLAGEGLIRVAEIAAALTGAPVEILIPRAGSDGSDGTATERYVAGLVAGGGSERPAEVVALVPILSGEELQGAVVMLGEGGEGAEAHLTAAALAALTGVAILNAREGVTLGADRDLIGDLLSRREMRPSEIVRRARMRGCDLTGGVSALCISPGEGPAGRVMARIAAERPDALAEACDGRIYVLLPGSIEEAKRLAARLPEGSANALSSRYRQAAHAGLALEEAELLLAMVEASGYLNADRPTWDSLRLLWRSYVADPGELSRFSEQTVGTLIGHDEQNDSELQATFWSYQENNCNMNLTAQSTFTHRHTVANRLARIEELTGLDPNRSYDRELLSLALKAHLVVGVARPR